MSSLFQRPELAEGMANQLLNPGVLDEGLRSGLFLSGLRRKGKTNFLRNDKSASAHCRIVCKTSEEEVGSPKKFKPLVGSD